MSRQRFINVVFVILAMSWLSACGMLMPIDTEVVGAESTLPKIGDYKPTAHADEIQGLNDSCTSIPSLQVAQACEAQNGIMQQAGMMGCYLCVLPYSDAGKTCQDVSDCLGTCKTKPGEFLATSTSGVSGECSKDNMPFGCYQTILKGVPQSALCVD